MSNFVENSFLHWLSVELSKRMAEKLQFIKATPESSLVIDDSSPDGLERLRDLYPNTKLYGTTQIAGGFFNLIKNLFGKGIPKFFAVKNLDGDRLDLADRQMDLLWVNAWRFHHDDSWKMHLKEWHRVLRPEGLLMFSYLGPDTAKELRSLNEFPKLEGSAISDAGPRGPRLFGLDMHDMGDGLVEAGFSDPVMDMEYLTLTYQEADLFIKDAQALGFLPKVLHDPELEVQIQQLKGEDGVWKLTLEVVYGHAWWASPRFTGVAIIRPEDIKLKSK